MDKPLQIKDRSKKYKESSPESANEDQVQYNGDANHAEENQRETELVEQIDTERRLVD